MNGRNGAVVRVAAAVCMLTVGPAASAPAQTLKLATLANQGSVWDQTIRAMGERWKKETGKNLITFRSGKRLLASGFCWPETLKLLAGTPYVVHQSLRQGNVIAFADDPNQRAFSPRLQRLFFNAVFFGPGR